MGNCFSDPSKAEAKSKPSGQGQKLGSGPARPSAQTPSSSQAQQAQRPAKSSAPPRTLGGGSTLGSGEAGVGDSEGDARDRALRAAEERAKAANKKGVVTANPKAGQLSAKLAAERKSPNSPNQGDERLMDRGQWN